MGMFPRAAELFTALAARHVSQRIRSREAGIQGRRKQSNESDGAVDRGAKRSRWKWWDNDSCLEIIDG